MNKDQTHVLVRWETCICSLGRQYRLIARQAESMVGTGVDAPVLVTQERIDGEWVDDTQVGNVTIDGTYEVVDVVEDKWGDNEGDEDE